MKIYLQSLLCVLLLWHNVAYGQGGSNTLLGFVFVKGGTFQMGRETGEPDEKPVHKVTVSGFYICDHEVTQKEWQELMNSSPSFHKGCDNCPVENISWNDVREYLDKLNEKTGKHFRLPTEAEWEYAARGGVKNEGYLYSGSNDLASVAWYYANSGNTSHQVKQKKPNALGIYDMTGNVYEWCADGIGNYTNEPQVNPMGAGINRVVRGGAWDYDAPYCTVYSRDSGRSNCRSVCVGFRVVLIP